MQQSLSASTRYNNKTLPIAILITWLIAGTLDLSGAYIVHGLIMGDATFTGILKYIASAAFGKEAFAGGSNMVFAGILFHYFIALCFTVFYYIVYPSISFLHKHVLLSGVLYGIFVWAVMNLIVVPMTKIQQAPFQLKGSLIAASILVVCIGLSVTLLAHRYYRSRVISRDSAFKKDSASNRFAGVE